MIQEEYNFKDIFLDDSKNISKINLEEITNRGNIAVIDQSRKHIAGYVEESNYKVCKNERIIFGDHTRIIKYINIPFIAGADGVKTLKLKDEKNCLYKFFYYYLQYIDIPNNGYSRHFKFLKEKEFIIPPIEFQKKVVEALEKIEELIENKENQEQKLEEMAKSQFYEIFGDVGKNTKGYPTSKLSDIAEYWNGLTYKPKDISENGILVLRSSNIQNGQLSFEDNVRVNCQIPDKKLVKNNDILMCSRNGSARLVGKVALIKDIDEKMAFGAFMMIIRSKYYPYLLYYFQTDAFRTQILNGETATINQITRYMLNNVKIPLPLDEEIERFASSIELIDKQKEICNKIIDKLNELKKSKMQEYFGGVINE